MVMVARELPLQGQGFDALVIGGGINGMAITRELARNGLRALLVEQNDFASGVTSRSTRIIHGGLRYLELGEISLVRESLRERELLLRQSPHLVHAQQFLLVMPGPSRSLLRSSLAVRTGLWLYHRWAGGQKSAPPDLKLLEQQLDAGKKWSIYSYEDAQCEFPERLVAEWLVESVQAGAMVRNHTTVLSVTHSNGRVTGARLRDEISRQEYEVAAKWVINATGPWADLVATNSGIKAGRMLGGVRGSHLVLPRFAGAPQNPVYTEAVDGRPIFVIPWNHQLMVGTTEVADSSAPDSTAPTQEEINYLFNSFTGIFPRSGLTLADVRYAFAGVRPLPYAPGKSYSSVTRRHILHDHKDDDASGMISVIGGKLTTATSLARDVARKLGANIPDPVCTFAAPVPEEGVEQVVRQWSHAIATKARIREDCAQGIAEWHGRHALAIAHAASLDELLREPICSHSCHLVAEAVNAVAHESAITLGDIVLRRVPVALGACWTEACTREAAAKIGAAVGWDQARVHQEVDALEQERERFLHPKHPTVPGAPSVLLPSLAKN
jgi:glycerol-3-phosphate dehydrogenase